MVFKQNKLILYLFMLIFLIAGIFIIIEGDFLGGILFVIISLAGIYFVTKLENSVEFTHHCIKIEKPNKAIMEIPYDNIHSIKVRKKTNHSKNNPRTYITYHISFFDNRRQPLYHLPVGLKEEKLKELILFFSKVEPRLIYLLKSEITVNSLLAELNLLSVAGSETMKEQVELFDSLMTNHELNKNNPDTQNENDSTIYLNKGSVLTFTVIAVIIFIVDAVTLFMTLIASLLNNNFNPLIECFFFISISLIPLIISRSYFGKNIVVKNGVLHLKKFKKTKSTLEISNISSVNIKSFSYYARSEDKIGIEILDARYQRFCLIKVSNRAVSAFQFSKLLKEYPELNDKIKLEDSHCPHAKAFLQQLDFFKE